jgi:hypothetical protein
VLRIQFQTDPDPAFHSDTDPTFYFDSDRDPTILYGSESLPFQRGNVPETVHFIHPNLIFFVSRYAMTQPAGLSC